MTIMSCHEEIIVNYNYSPAVAAPWYKEAKHTWSQLQSQ